ncbi:RHBGA protein, partial [Alectura lathami]|nr:RHBGA protein [Alectura lathami]
MALPTPTCTRRLLPLSLGLFQAALLLFFTLFITSDEHSAVAVQAEDAEWAAKHLHGSFSFFQDIQVMLVVGLGLLLAFRPHYRLSALVNNFLLLNFSVQWVLVLQGLLHHLHHGKVLLGLRNILSAKFSTVTVLISVGAVLGRMSPCQLLAVAFCEVPVYLATEWLIVTRPGILDVGSIITFHIFACYFGLDVSRALFGMAKWPPHPKQTPTPCSDLLALVGTLTLWVFLPSFAAALCQRGDAQHRAILHTLLALSASVVTTVVASSLLGNGGKLSPGHLQNGSLAAGVAINMPITPVAASALGSLSSLACILAFKFLTPLLVRKLALGEKCRIHNLHGLPGILGAAASAVAVLVASGDSEGSQMDRSGVAGGHGGTQALWQVAGLAVALGGSLVAGLPAGTVLRLPCLAPPPEPLCFDDALCFQVQGQAESPPALGGTAEEAPLATKE